VTVLTPGGRRLIAVVACAHDHPTSAVAIGIVVQETEARRWGGPIVARLAELRGDVPAHDAMMLAALRALEVARDRGARIVKVRGTFPRNQRGHVAHVVGTVMTPTIAAGLRQVLAELDFARVQWCARSKTLEPRGLARGALPITARARLDNTPPMGDVWEPRDGDDLHADDRDGDVPF